MTEWLNDEEFEQWFKINGWDQPYRPWFELEPRQLVEILLDKIDFLDIIEECGVEYWECSAGEFTHRMRCPLPIHDFGGERTASFYIDRKKNNFYCFGCNSHGNVIDFVILIKPTIFHEALKFLCGFTDITDEDLDDDARLPRVRKKDPEDMVETHVFRAGVLIRDYLNKIKDSDEYEKKKARIDSKQFPKLDSFLDKDDAPAAKAHYEKLVELLKDKV